jgi:hypothetical protein
MAGGRSAWGSLFHKEDRLDTATFTFNSSIY